MKKLSKKLSLNKETMAVLNNSEMNNVEGGGFTGFLSLGKVCHSNNNPNDCATTGGKCGG